MNGQESHAKPHGGGWFNRELKNFVLFLSLISFSNLIFSNNTFASYTPTLSASVDNTAASVNGNQVINSTNKTTEIPLNLTVNTNNKTGYTATLNSETDETALVNNGSTNGAKINSISSAGLLGDFSNNTWGVKVGYSTNFLPIPKLTAPMNVRQTTWRTYSNDTNSIKIGMKLSDSLESGRYTNKLIFSILTNNYDPIAIMMAGDDFNTKLKSLETTTNKIEHFKKSTVTPDASMNAVNIEGWESDYEIKLWLNPTEKTAYYYAEPEKVYLSTYLHHMFFGMSNLTTLDVSHFDTSKVTNMEYMFSGMYSLTTLNVSNFDTSKVTNMESMFSGTSLTTLDVSHFDTSKVTTMRGMFSYMPNLTTLNVSNFDTSKVTNMDYMFYSMPNLTTLNVSNFDTSKVTSMGSMFALADAEKLKDKLETIYVNNDFNTANLTWAFQMFGNRKKLRGGNGSYLADPSTADKTWLRVDRPGAHGYFTRKP